MPPLRETSWGGWECSWRGQHPPRQGFSSLRSEGQKFAPLTSYSLQVVSTPLPLSRAARCGTGRRGKLFERSEFLPRRFRIPATRVVSAARMHFFCFFFWANKKRKPPGEGSDLLLFVPTHHFTILNDMYWIAALRSQCPEKNSTRRSRKKLSMFSK